jgi:hypothetical protein
MAVADGTPQIRTFFDVLHHFIWSAPRGSCKVFKRSRLITSSDTTFGVEFPKVFESVARERPSTVQGKGRSLCPQ